MKMSEYVVNFQKILKKLLQFFAKQFIIYVI